MTKPVLSDTALRAHSFATGHTEAESIYRDLFVTSRDALYITSVEGQVLACNPAFVSLLGYTASELATINAQDLYVNQADRERFEAEVAEHGWIRDFETVVRHKDGTQHECLLTASARRSDNAIIGYQGSIRDITEFKRLQGELSHAQKMESVGQLAAGVAHEINTPTQYVSDNVQFLSDAFTQLRPLMEKICAERAAESEDNTEDIAFLIEQIPLALTESIEGLNRVSSIVGAMKDFAHPGATERVQMDLKRIVESTATVSRNEWKYIAELHMDIPEDIGRIEGLAGELSQVLLNLVVNAAHAISATQSGQPGQITIRVVPREDTVDLVVTDNGCGIPDAIRDRVFDPFFTTKDVGKGTGQGLTLVRSVIVDKHGGTIEVDSELNVGTTITMRLPRTHNQSTHAQNTVR